MDRARATFIVLIVIALGLVAYVARPIASGLLLASIFAGAFFPVQRRLAARLGGRRSLAALLLSLAIIGTIALPLALTAHFVVGEVVDAVQHARRELRAGGVEGLIESLPAPVEGLARRLASLFPSGANGLPELAQRDETVAVVGGAVAATGDIALQVLVTTIALFFLLSDGDRLVAWLDRHAPLRPGQTRELLGEFRRTAAALLRSTVITAAVQAAVAVPAYLATGVPRPAILTLVTFMIAMIPGVGGGLVVGGVGVATLLAGEVWQGIVLIAWGAGVVGTLDNVVRAVLMRGGMEVHGAVIFFALIGGLASFGPIGLVAGPLCVAFLVALARIYERDFGTRRAAIIPPPAPTARRSGFRRPAPPRARAPRRGRRA